MTFGKVLNPITMTAVFVALVLLAVLIAGCGGDNDAIENEGRAVGDLPGAVSEFVYTTRGGTRLACVYVSGGYDGGLSCVPEPETGP